MPSGSQPERRLVSCAAVADSLGVSEAVAGVLLDVLDAVSPEPSAGSTGVGAGGAGARPAEGDMHHLLLLLFVNMYARPHVQSSLRNAGDVWPQGPGERGAAVPEASPSGKPGPLSPTKPRRAHPPGCGDDDASLALQLAFVLRHLAGLLPLLRSTPAAGSAGCAAP